MDFWIPIINFLLQTVSTFFCASAVLVFCHCFYDRGFLWNKKKALVLLIAALLDAYLTSTNDIILSILSVILVTLAATYDYKGKVKQALRFLVVYFLSFICTVFIGTNTACLLFPEECAGILLSFKEMFTMESVMPAIDIFPDIVYLIGYGLSFVFHGAIFLYLYFRLYKKGIIVKCGQVELALASVYPVLCVGTLIILSVYGVGSTQVTALLTVLSVLFALLLPVFVYYVRISRHFQERTVLQQSYMQQQLSQFNQYKLAQEETARFRHDIRNNLLCVNDLLHEGKTEEAMEYLHDLLKVSENLRQKYVTGDDMLNCIVGAKSSIFAANKIQFQLDGVLAGGLKWKPIDICNVFANALDNAVDACLQLPEKERSIQMAIRSTAQYWFVTIENPTRENVDTQQLFQKNGNYSSKEGMHHGIGTYNMRRTVESYKGQLKAHCENNRFTLEIMIDKSIA